MSEPASFDPRVPLLFILSMTTGMVDAASVLGLDRVFTANMTGNVVFLGFALARAPGFTPLPFVVAIASFLLGALAAGWHGRYHIGRMERHWLIKAAAAEAILLWISAAIAYMAGSSVAQSWAIYAIIALTAVAMGFRNATIRQLKIPDLTTTVLTLTLTGIAADTKAAGGSNPNWQRRIGAVLAILAGAVFGALLLLHIGLVAPLAIAGAIVLFGTIICMSHAAATGVVKG